VIVRRLVPVLAFLSLALLVACGHTTPVQPPVDLTKNPLFQTPDGNILCGDETVYNYRTFGGSAPAADPSGHITLCFIDKFSFAKPACKDDADMYDVFLTGDGYPGLGCGGEDRKVFLPDTPYKATDGQTVNLGTARCAVHTGSVSCTESYGAKRAFTLEQGAFTVPLAQGDAVQVLDPYAGMYALATSGKVRPATLDGVSEYGSIKGITWSSWTGTSAKGHGSYSDNTCRPDCASAHYVIADIDFTLSLPVISCGKWFFTKLDYTPVGGGAPGSLTIGPPDYKGPDDSEPCDATHAGQ
jgi:hypothetical protein